MTYQIGLLTCAGSETPTVHDRNESSGQHSKEAAGYTFSQAIWLRQAIQLWPSNLADGQSCTLD